MQDTSHDIISAFSGQSILVVGDVMLDEYIWGDVRRISPEAPVPVVETRQRTYRPGGAGNVAANIGALGGLPLLCGVVGADPPAEQLAQALALDRPGIVVGLIRSPSQPTTVKSRIVAHGQQMLRLDTEANRPIPPEAENMVLAWCDQRMAQATACVLSDYAKGVLTERVCRALIELARARGLPVVVDPKGRDYGKYAGATVVTPNTHEAAVALGLAPGAMLDADRAAEALLGLLPGTSLLITHGAAGMSLYRAGQPRVHIPARTRPVYDVTGAGDTVVATLALAVAAGAPLERAAVIANAAAGIVVGKVGTATVALDELRDALG
jgi:rfaE bifunctional protein kinase chain/domain